MTWTSQLGKYGVQAGGSSIHYLGTKKITANVAISFPNNVGFAVVKLFGARGNSGAGGYTAIKLGPSSAGQTYYITNDGNESPGGTWINNPQNGSSTNEAESNRSTRGGGFVSISTATMGPGGGSAPTKQATVLGLAGGGGSRHPQTSGSAPAGHAGYPAGVNGNKTGPQVGPGGLGGNASAPFNPSGSPLGNWPVGGVLSGNHAYGPSPSQPGGGNQGGGGGAGYIGGGHGLDDSPASHPHSTGGGRGGSGGGGSNFYVPSSNPHIAGVANSVYSHAVAWDTTDPDYDSSLGAPTNPYEGQAVGTTGYAVIKFFGSAELNYDSPDYPSSQATDGF